MDVSSFGRIEYVLVDRILAHARNVCLDRCRKELNVLWQIADAFTELARVPIAQIHHVEAHVSRGRDDRSDKHARKHRLARSGIADNCQRLPRIELEADAVQNDLLGRWRDVQDSLDTQMPLRTGQTKPVEIQRRILQEALDPSIGRTCLDKSAPAFDGAFHRRQCPARNNRCSDNHAACELAFQSKPCPPSEDRDLGTKTQKFGHARHHDVEILTGDLGLQRFNGLVPPHANALGDHPHGVDDLRISRHRFSLQIGTGAECIGAGEWNRGDALIE